MATESSEETKAGVTLLLTGSGGYDKMKVIPATRPDKDSFDPNSVVVHIQANGINFAELMCRQGLYDRIPKLPAILGFEGSGDVIMVGKNVTKFKIGDRVICSKHDFGLWTEFPVVPESCCFAMPKSMTYEEGAAIPVNYITAFHMLFNLGGLRKGQSVLIHMAAGGVGTAAIQLCRTVPNVTIFGTASASKHDLIRKLGVDHAIDYRTQDYVEEIRKIQPGGVDIVLDPLSGADAVKGFDLLKPLGKIVHFGAANAVSGAEKSYWSMMKMYFGMKSYTPMSLMPQNKAVCGYHLGHLTDTEAIDSAMTEILSLYDQGKIKPQIDTVWSYDDIGKAMARMHDRLNVGKVIIKPHKAPEGEQH